MSGLEILSAPGCGPPAAGVPANLTEIEDPGRRVTGRLQFRVGKNSSCTETRLIDSSGSRSGELRSILTLKLRLLHVLYIQHTVLRLQLIAS